MAQNPFQKSAVDKKILSYEQRISHRQEIIRSIKAKANMRRTRAEQFADWMTAFFGTSAFLWFNIIWFVLWLLINTESLPFIPAFDPYPFGVLTMVVSLEAIVLAIIVLISQNRSAKISELREEIDIQVNMIAEMEITKTMKLMALLLEKNGINIATDPELKTMLEPMDMEKIKQALESEM